ncbi:hypothetical protein BJ508DRAFT_409984 [Ascobolus immersus RN42]|uniref:Required for respiratory growth protein 7, mitochondrial n=1 Tax=Ascobolus immersus RN42 TaxID=1160509 RepID=A0A3N4IPG6_ASCIM|nr:hypothetical protein BJ508DRAFT_409984 [Ascobolus immersus RN42]
MPPRIRPQTLESYLSTLPTPLPPPSKRSSVLRGTLFEYTVQSSLQQSFPGLILRKTGGAGDGGVDLIGRWELPPSHGQRKVVNPDTLERKEAGVPETPEGKRKISVLVQCKSFSSPSMLGPKTIRELAGTLSNAYFAGLRLREAKTEEELEDSVMEEANADEDSTVSSILPALPSPSSCLGLLAVPFALTKSLQKAILASGEWGIIVVHVRDFDEGGGVVGLSWNEKARQVLGGSVSVRNTRGGVKVRIVDDEVD